jgi:hypothetical protein
MQENTYAAGIASQLPAHDGNSTSPLQRRNSRSNRQADIQPAFVAAPKPLARLGRAILQWLDKEDDRVALI